MPELVMVSSVEKKEQLKALLEERFAQGRYGEMTQAIGMHSILIDPEHTMQDQDELYHFVLKLIKDRIAKAKGKNYGAWYTGFPKLLDELLASKKVVTTAAATDVIESHRAAFGSFASLDHFFFWALDDRRLSLAEIVAYIEKTAA
jgi:hypothetical protein